MSHSISSGIEGLDEIIGGGFPRGSIIILAGNPGTGKTIFSAQFLYHGCTKYGENGIYVSFAEEKEKFFEEMKNFNFDFEKLEKEGHFFFLDMVTTKEEAISTIMETITSKINEIKAKRLVIDSFSAMVQAFKEPHCARILLHTILSKITRSIGCTTILIVEIPYGETKIGLGIEEFVADGIIVLKRSIFNDRILRELEIYKMRGIPISESQVIFTLKDRFKAFSSFKFKPIEKSNRFKPKQDNEMYFSSGSQDIDKVFGGWPKGSTILFDIGDYVSSEHYHLFGLPTIWNFLAHGRGIIMTPSAGVDYTLLKDRIKRGGFTNEEINKLIRIYTRYHPKIKMEPCIVTFEGANPIEDFEKRAIIAEELIEETGQPVLNINGVDMLIDSYGVRGTLSYLKACANRTRVSHSLCALILKPGYPRLASILSSIADIHLKFVRRHGITLVYGYKPGTNIYVLEMDTSEGYPMPKLTPII